MDTMDKMDAMDRMDPGQPPLYPIPPRDLTEPNSRQALHASVQLRLRGKCFDSYSYSPHLVLVLVLVLALEPATRPAIRRGPLGLGSGGAGDCDGHRRDAPASSGPRIERSTDDPLGEIAVPPRNAAARANARAAAVISRAIAALPRDCAGQSAYLTLQPQGRVVAGAGVSPALIAFTAPRT